MANECPKKEVKSNHVRVTEEITDSSEGAYEPDTSAKKTVASDAHALRPDASDVLGASRASRAS